MNRRHLASAPSAVVSPHPAADAQRLISPPRFGQAFGRCHRCRCDRSLHVRRPFLLLAALAAGSSGFAQEQTGSYREDLDLVWGQVALAATGGAPRETWYLTSRPAFAAGRIFSPEETALLRTAFDQTAGTLGEQPVWRVERPALAAFRSAVERSARLTITSMSPPPARPAKSAGATRKWTLDFDWSRPAAPPAPPKVELTLRVPGIRPGEALRVPLAAALAANEPRRYAGLQTAETAALAAAADWLQLFLVAPDTLAAAGSPAITVADASPADLATYAIPIAFGLRAFGEITAVLGPDPDRRFSAEHTDALHDRLAGAHRFAGAGQWFPQLGQPGDLDGADVAVDPSKPLVTISHPDAEGNFAAPRVLAEDEWAVLAGPFCRMTRADASVGFVKGKEHTYAVADLPKVIPDESARRRYEEDLAAIDVRLQRAVRHQHLADGEFFWRDRVKTEHARAMRSMEAVPFVEKVTAEFGPDGVTYVATYAPARIDVKAGVAYSAEQRFGANVAAGWSALFQPQDTFNVSIASQEKSVSGELAYRTLLQRDTDRRKYHWLSLSAHAGRDDNYLLRDLAPRAFRNETRSGTLEHEYTVRAPIAAGADHEPWNATLKTSLSVESFRLSPLDLPGTDQDAGLVLRHREAWTFLPRSTATAAVIWEHVLAPAVAWAPGVGWASGFGLAEITAVSKAKFGGEAGAQENAMYASVRLSLGGSSGRLPAGYRYRLGDNDRLMGLEPGEFSGRSFAHGELIYGLNLGHALRNVFKNNQGERIPPPSALAQLNLEAIAEAGTISPARGFGAFDAARTRVSSYGIGLNKPAASKAAASFRFGYAWSPESTHTHGRLFLSATLGF